MKFSKPGKSFPSQTIEQNMIIERCALVMITTLLMTSIISIMFWVNSPVTTFFRVVSAHGRGTAPQPHRGARGRGAQAPGRGGRGRRDQPPRDHRA